MTKGQETIIKYLKTQFVGVRYIPKDDDIVIVRDKSGAEMQFTLNLYGDILDAATREIVAVSDLPHDILQIGVSDPKTWTNSLQYFG